MSPNRSALAVAATLALGGVASAQQIARPLSTIPSALSTGRIACRGVSNVPLTADQEQALPLRVVRTLNCGESVAVLADSGGYTVNVRTEDGTAGYVARLYFRKDETPAVPKTITAAVINGVARWQPGASGSEQLVSNGLAVESLTANGLTVQVSLHDTGWKLRANVAVVNSSERPVLVQPVLFRLEEHAPNFRSLAFQDALQLAKATNHQILWTRSDAGVMAIGGNSSDAARMGGKYQAAAYSPSSPVYLAQQPALDNTARVIRATALQAGAAKPGGKSTGAVWFERDAHAKDLLLRIPVGGVVYEFPLSFAGKN